MREIRLSGSMSGNRKQSQAKPDCGADAKASLKATGRLKPLRLFSTLLIEGVSKAFPRTATTFEELPYLLDCCEYGFGKGCFKSTEPRPSSQGPWIPQQFCIR